MYSVEDYYRVYKKLNAFSLNLRAMENRFQNELSDLHKELFPRRRIINTANLPNDKVREMQERYHAEIRRIKDRRTKTAFIMINRIRELVDPESVRKLPEGEHKIVKSSGTDMYLSQTNSHGYAKGYLFPWQDCLVEAGYDTRIEYERMSKGTRRDGSTWDSGMYHLYANCTEAVAWYCYYTVEVDPQASVEKRGLNYRVYDPFLSYE